jgi:hypothetical protein
MSMEMAEARPPIAARPPSSAELETRVRIEKTDLRTRAKHEGPLLVICAAVLAFSFAIPSLKSRHLWINFPCIFRAATHVPCPMCGMTRSFIFTAHGNLEAALNMHLLGPLLFFLVAATTVYLAVSVVSGYRVRLTLSPRVRRIAFWSVAALFVACWIVKLVFMRGTW